MATNEDRVQSAVARLAVAQRPDRKIDPQTVKDRRNDLVAARLERCVREALAPTDKGYEPLRAEDRRRVAAMLLDGLRDERPAG
jgi:hypothetical protein